MAIFQVIDTSATGDQFYEGMVKDAANWAIEEGRIGYTTVASHATTSAIWAAAGDIINFTGTETITNFPAANQAGMQKWLVCAGACTFTHAGAISVQGGATYTAAAGDIVIVTATTTTAFKVSIFSQSAFLVGGIKTIASGSLPAAAVLDIINIPVTYTYLILQITGVSSNTETRIPLVQASVDNGSTFDATAGNYRAFTVNNSTLGSNAVASMIYATAVAAAIASTFSLYLYGYQGGANAQYFSRVTVNNQNLALMGSYVGSTDNIDALRILWNDTGNFDAGTYALYGVS